MGSAHLPPQAYTRDMLASAYEWLKSQPPSVRELASSANDLVALYLQARRRPNSKATQVSSETFKSDLKDLAEGFRQFEGEAPQEPILRQEFAEGAPKPHTQTPLMAPQAPTVQTPASQAPAPQQTTAAQAPAPTASQVATPRAPALQAEAPKVSGSNSLNLDMKSVEILRRVQSQLNLSSEHEALRMLITLGFEKVREILPKA